MGHPRWAVVGCLAVLLAVGPIRATAENEGLADLDKATERKLSVKNLNDLTSAIDLAQAALNKGLDDQNAAFARKLLAEALMERASALTEGLVTRDLRVAPAARVRLWSIAVADLKRLVRLDAKRPRAYYLLGRLEAMAGNQQEARKALDKAIANAGQEHKRILAEAFALRGTLQPTAEKQQADLDRAIALVPNRVETLRARARLFEQQDKYDRALADLNRAVKLDPKDAATYALRGSVLSAKHDDRGALKDFDQAIKLAPSVAAVYAQRGQIKIRQNQPVAALADLNKALELDPGAHIVLLLRAHARLLTGKAQDALADVEKAIQLEPGFLPAIRLRAEILANTDQLDTAITSLKTLAEARPKDIELQMQLARYYLADRRADQAIRIVNNVLKTHPKHAAALRFRGDARLAAGHQAQAIADYEAALKLEPDASSLLNNLAWVLATSPEKKLRDGKRAIRLAIKACQVTDYKLPHILSTLAAAYAETGQFDTAIQWSQKAVTLGQGGSQITQLKKELESYRQKKPWRELQTLEENQQQRAASKPDHPQPKQADQPSKPTAAPSPAQMTSGFDNPSRGPDPR